MNRGRSRYCDC